MTNKKTKKAKTNKKRNQIVTRSQKELIMTGFPLC